MAKNLKIMLKRSLIGSTKGQIATIHSLGLRKINQVVEHNDTPDIRGKINKMSHLLEVKEIDA